MIIGLMGHAVRSGVGHVNRDIWDTMVADEWLVVRHPQLGIDDTVCPGNAICCGVTEGEPVKRFLDSVDVVLLVEQPPLTAIDVLASARSMGKLVVCVPMVEWLPYEGGWARHVDAMWAPTQWSTGVLASLAGQHPGLYPWQDRVWGGRWGIHVERFPFEQRSVANRFLYVNGRGGVQHRKGVDLFAEAARLCPDVPFIVRSQTTHLPAMPHNVQVELANRYDRQSLYAGADVLVAPSRWEGFGLQLYEAAACGLPVITTAGGAMAESPCFMSVGPNRYETRAAGHTISIEAHECNPSTLAAVISDVCGRDLTCESLNAHGEVHAGHNLPDICRELRRAIYATLVDAKRVAV